MRLTHIFLGILLFIVVSIIMMTVAVDIGEPYNATFDKDFIDIQRNLTASNDNLRDLIGEDIASKSPGGGDESDISEGDLEGGIIKSSYKAIKEVPGLFNVFKKLVTLISQKLKVPVILYSTAFISLVIVISLILLSTVLRNKL